MDSLAILIKASAAADGLLECCGIHQVAKAMDLGTKAGFDQAVFDFAADLRKLASLPERDAVAVALRTLDVDWASTTARQRSELVNDAMVAARRALAVIPTKQEVTVSTAATDVVSAGRADAISSGASAIGMNFNAVDDRIVTYLQFSHRLYVTDEYGRRITAFEASASQIIEAGIVEGLGRDEMATKLQRAATKDIASRSRFYWKVVAGAFTNRGRSFAQVSGYAEAGFEKFKIEAVLDEATTNFCRAIHGTVFTVRSGLDAFANEEHIQSQEEIKDSAPWVRETKNDDGTTEMWVKKGGRRVSVGTVMHSAVGAADKRGDFARFKSADGLVSLGVSLPPYHGLCRTTTVPVFN